MKSLFCLLCFLLLAGCLQPADTNSCAYLAKQFDKEFNSKQFTSPDGNLMYSGATLIEMKQSGDKNHIDVTFKGAKKQYSFGVLAADNPADVPLQIGEFYKFPINRFRLSGANSGSYDAFYKNGTSSGTVAVDWNKTFQKIDC